MRHRRNFWLFLLAFAGLGLDCGRSNQSCPTEDSGLSQVPPNTDASTEVAKSVPYWRGMTFAHMGYDGIRGYGGSATEASLDSLAKLGIDALAVVPYTFMRDANHAMPLSIPTRLGTETDEAVIAAIQQAHERKWRVMLKPQIWLHNAWPGDISFDTPSEWEVFFGHYRTWMLHYAQLAAAQQVEALCIGTELGEATLQHPEFWRKLIAEIRTVYPGTLTYAANWGEEFEGITFWAALDVVGLNAYYPLSPKPNPTDAELAAGAREWMQMAERISAAVDKPLWLTEVGYRSVNASWQNPHAEVEGRDANAEHQARSYRALLAAAKDSPRLRGIFIWKWPSFLYNTSPAEQQSKWQVEVATEFVPAHPKTAKMLRQFYLEWK